ncbi:MAG: ABC transporter permease [Imperialibacter sp.]|uniref:ABC transporter permease n=1 Tax=Imperialibacter sp. TaxID=2038411 RepID=UPI0032F06AB6
MSHHLLFSLRSLWRFRSTAFLQIVGFVVGLGALIPVLMVLYYHMRFDKFHDKADRIVRVSTRVSLPESTSIYAATSKSLAPLLKEQMADVEEVVRYRYMPASVTLGDQNLGQSYPLFADPGFFNMFSAQVVAGNIETALQTPDGLVINQTTAVRFFGEDDPIGQTVSLETPAGSFSVQVKAVIRDYPENVSFAFDMATSYSHAENAMRDNVGALVPGNFTYLLMKATTDETLLAEEFASITEKHFPEGMRDVMSLLPVAFTEVHYTNGHQFDSGRKGSKLNDLALGVLAAFLLLVSIANYVNLATALLMRRSKELAIRKIMGEPVGQQYGQLLVESVCMLSLVILLINVLTFFLVPEIEAMLNITLRTGLFTGVRYYLFTFFFGLAVAGVSSVIPFWLVSRTISVTNLKGAVAGHSRLSLRYGLLGLQLIVSVLFAVIALGMDEQLRFIKNKDLGFSKEHVVTMSITDPQVNAKADAIKQAFLQQSFVKATSISLTPITGDHVRAQFRLGADSTGATPMMNANYVDADFDEVYQVKLVAGRFFSKEFASDIGRAFVLNKKAVEAFGFDSPQAAVGQTLSKVLADSLNTGTIIGVMEDYHFQSLYQELEPMIWQIVPASSRNLLAVKLDEGDVEEKKKKLGAVLNDLGITQEVEFTSLTDALDMAYREDDRLSFFIRLSAGVIVLISLLGVFGLAAFILETRRKEMGIRKLLGADLWHIMVQMGRPFAAVLAVGLVVGGPVSYYFLGNWLNSFAFHVSASLWYVPAAAILIGVLMATSVYRQVNKAAATNPAEVLREE